MPSSLAECPTCAGLGWLRNNYPVGHPKFGDLDPCPDCKPQADLTQQRLKEHCRLIGDLEVARFDNWEHRDSLTEVLNRAKAFFNDGQGWGWLTLSGPPGTGKTHLLASVVAASVAKGRTAIYATLAELLDDLRETYQPSRGVSFSRLLADLEQAEVLALDEIEKINPTGWAEEQLFKLIENRYRRLHDTMTVMATNVDLRDRNALIIDSTRWPGYLEDRLWDGRNEVVTDFWTAETFRPLMDVVEKARTGRNE